MKSPEFLALLKSDLERGRTLEEKIGLALDRILTWRPYFWIGIYKVEGQKAKRVNFRGPLPPCHEFEFGKGNVGTAAMKGIKKVISDVSTDPTYSMCFIDTKSELVLPIFLGNKVVGVLDVESDEKDFFTLEDEEILAKACSEVASLLK
ncbi:MAG: GAF domain-containing protein [Bdellovibrionota bacterium]